MAQLDLATANAVLKEDYRDELRSFLNNNNFIQSQIGVNTEDVSGRRALHAAHVRRSSAVGSRGESGNSVLPTARAQGYTNFYVPIRYHYGRIQLSGPTIAAMVSDRTSFLRALESEMSGIKDDTTRDRSRQTWGTSNGVIAQTGVSTATTTIVLGAGTTGTQIRQLWNDGGMRIDIGTIASPASIASDREVVSFDEAAGTITISGANVTTNATTHFISRTGNGGTSNGSGMPNDGQFELTGLQTMISDTLPVHGLDPATQPTWKSRVWTGAAGNRPLNEQLVNKAIQQAAIDSGRSNINLLVGSAGVSRAAAARLEAIRRNVDKVDLKAGYSGIAWSTPGEGMGKSTDVVLCWDQDAPENTLSGIATEDLVKYQMQDWDWMDMDGSVWSRVPNTDAYEATLYCYDELAIKQRNNHFRIEDITEA